MMPSNVTEIYHTRRVMNLSSLMEADLTSKSFCRTWTLMAPRYHINHETMKRILQGIYRFQGRKSHPLRRQTLVPNHAQVTANTIVSTNLYNLHTFPVTKIMNHAVWILLRCPHREIMIRVAWILHQFHLAGLMNRKGGMLHLIHSKRIMGRADRNLHLNL